MGILKNRLGLLATVAALPFLIYLSWHYTFTSVGPLAETGRRVEIPDKADIVIGILPEQNVFIQKKRFEPLEEYLSRKLDRKEARGWVLRQPELRPDQIADGH